MDFIGVFGAQTSGNCVRVQDFSSRAFGAGLKGSGASGARFGVQDLFASDSGLGV